MFPDRVAELGEAFFARAQFEIDMDDQYQNANESEDEEE
jgi:hypothetical protein